MAICTDENLSKLADFCKAYVLPHASSTHRVEACIREASHVASTGRSEEMRSAMVVQRSVGNTQVNRKVQEESRGRELHGNQHMTQGKQGQRECKSENSKKKHNGDSEGITQATIHTRGHFRGKLLLENTMERYERVGAPEFDEKRKGLMGLFKDKSLKSSASRAKIKQEKFRETSRNARPLNKIQRARGVDIPTARAGLVTIGQIGKMQYLAWVRGELTARSIEYFDGDGIRALVKLLKTRLFGVDGKAEPFSPITDLHEDFTS
jgi:hypothetical protein